MERCDFTINIGLVGNSDVGKTCLIRRYTDPDNFKLPSKKISTIGIDQVTLKLKINDYLVRIVIWDPAGQERFESLTTSFFKGLDGVLLVFDLTNERSHVNLTKWLN
jgi:small GTP-binding protein